MFIISPARTTAIDTLLSVTCKIMLAIFQAMLKIESMRYCIICHDCWERCQSYTDVNKAGLRQKQSQTCSPSSNFRNSAVCSQVCLNREQNQSTKSKNLLWISSVCVLLMNLVDSEKSLTQKFSTALGIIEICHY